MSKAPRRWVTVENTRSLSDSGEKRKPSVFERLGSAPGRSSTSSTPQCKKWATTGACNYGNTCRFRHGPRRSDREKSPTDLRQKVVRKRDKESESESEGEKEGIKKKKDKESKVKSTVVVQPSKYKDNSDESDSEDVDHHEDDNEMDETMRLERKRQQLQRELSRLEAEDDSDRHTGVEKPVHTSSSLDETSDTGPSTPPHKGSHSRAKHDQTKKPKHPEVSDENQSRKKSAERKKTPKLAKKKSHHPEYSSDEESFSKEKSKKKVVHVPERLEKPKRDRSAEDKAAKTAAKSKKKPVEKRSRTRTMSTTSTSSTSSSSTSPSSSSQSSSSEDEEYLRPRKKSTKSPDQRRRKSSEHKRHAEGKHAVPDKAKKDKQRNKPTKSPAKAKRGHSPSTSYDERQRRESPDDRSRSGKKSLSPSEGRKGAQGKAKHSLSPPRESKRKSGVSPAPRTRSPGRNHSPDRGRRERSQETGGRGRKGGEDARRRQSPSESRSTSKYEAPSEGTRASRRPPSPEDRHQRDRRDESNTRRGDSPDGSRRDKQRSLDRQTGRRNVSNDNFQKRQPTPEQRGRQMRDNRDARDTRGGERRGVTPDGGNERNRRDQSLGKGRRGVSQEDDSRERPSPSSKAKSRQEDSGRRQMTQDNSDRHRPISPAPNRDRGRSPQRGQERNERGRDRVRRPISPEQDRGKNLRGMSADTQRKGRSPPFREDLKGRRGRSPQRQQDFDRNRGQQDYRDSRDNRDNVGDDNIQNRILSMAGYQNDRRGNDRRGDRMGREIDYRKNTQEDVYDRNVRDRDQSKGRQPQFHDDYQDQGVRDRRGDRSRYDEVHDQRRARDQQWDDRRGGDERYGDERRGDDRRSDGMRERYGREIDNRGRDGAERRPDMRKRPMDDDRGRSPPNKQSRRDASPSESHLSTGSRGRRDEWDAKQQARSKDRGENEREFDRKGRDGREMHDNRDGSQKRGRSPSDDRRQPKRQKAQPDDKKISASTDDGQRRPDSQSEKRGSTAEEFSDWSDNDTDAELLSQPNEDKGNANRNDGETEGFEKDGGKERGRERESNKEEHGRRSASRTSIGSRHSFREDRAGDRKYSKEEPLDRSGNRGGRNRDQRWKGDDREGRADKSDRKDNRRDRDRKQSDPQDFKEKESEQISETEKDGDKNKKRTGSVSSSQHSAAEAEGESVPRHGGDDGIQRQDTEVSSEADTDKKKLDMEYDEISDDDLDELIENADADEDQEQSKAGIVDSLDIDWASLCSLSKPKSAPATTSALNRFTGANVFARIGLSKAYAGDALFKKIQEQCRAQLVKDSEAGSSTDDAQKTKEQPKFEFLNDVAMLHGNAVQKLKMRMSIMSSIGSHRRALCARTDLNIRRHLCKVSKNTEGLTMYPNPAMDQDLYKQSIQMLRQDRHSIEEKKEVANSKLTQTAA